MAWRLSDRVQGVRQQPLLKIRSNVQTKAGRVRAPSPEGGLKWFRGAEHVASHSTTGRQDRKPHLTLAGKNGFQGLVDPFHVDLAGYSREGQPAPKFPGHCDSCEAESKDVSELVFT
ncbi:predicted protein [Histoplasma capsulatum H143]|uniref:Uncharacterized protein n=1 Tax=Ajellomyces capsulatus (strain H143) TaxID=544712 RepID=C6HH25_AJECH|nr:predicted protein [Histoplasma capsulatum H143]